MPRSRLPRSPSPPTSHPRRRGATHHAAPDGWRIVDWEFARIGDPREDLGYYNAYSGAVPPNLAQLDLAAFLARFRERTGFDEEAVNPVTFGYFTVLSTVTSPSISRASLRESARPSPVPSLAFRPASV